MSLAKSANLVCPYAKFNFELAASDGSLVLNIGPVKVIYKKAHLKHPDMKKIICFTLMGSFFVFVLNGQTKEIYTHPEFDSLARDHTQLAILPFKVMLRLKHKAAKKLEPEDFEKLEKIEGEAIQTALQSYFLKQKEKDSFKVSFQDIHETNTLLAQAGWTDDSLRLKTSKQICQKLRVDGVISGTFMTTKLSSDEAAATLTALGIGVSAIAALFGGTPDLSGPGPTNTGDCTINVHEAKTGKLLWRYEKELSRGLGSKTNTIINAIMRGASKKFPYENIK